MFSGNGHILKDFYQPLVLVKSQFEPIIKMLVSLREETFVGLNDTEDNQMQAIESTADIQTNDRIDERVTPVMTAEAVKVNTRSKSAKVSRSLAKKRLKFDSSDTELEVSSDDSSDIDFHKTTGSSTKAQKNRVFNKKCVQKVDKINGLNRIIIESNGSSQTSPQKNSEKQRRHEYKTLLEVHSLLPVSGKTFCHIYGILRYRDFKQNTYQLSHQKA